MFVDWLVGSVYIPEYKERKREFDFLVKKKFADTHKYIYRQTRSMNNNNNKSCIQFADEISREIIIIINADTRRRKIWKEKKKPSYDFCIHTHTHTPIEMTTTRKKAIYLSLYEYILFLPTPHKHTKK